MSNSNISVSKLDLKELEEMVIRLGDQLRSLKELLKLSKTIKNLQLKRAMEETKALEEELIRKDTLILDRDCKIEKLTY